MTTLPIKTPEESIQNKLRKIKDIPAYLENYRKNIDTGVFISELSISAQSAKAKMVLVSDEINESTKPQLDLDKLGLLVKNNLKYGLREYNKKNISNKKDEIVSDKNKYEQNISRRAPLS